jgi:hypothetical protein
VGSGPYRALANIAKPTSYNHVHAPVWEGAELRNALAKIHEKYGGRAVTPGGGTPAQPGTPASPVRRIIERESQAKVSVVPVEAPMPEVKGRAIESLCRLWDEVTEDFLAGRPTNVRPPLDAYFRSYGSRQEVQLEGFCEPFLGSLDRKPKMVFLSLNPGAVQPRWQHLEWNGRSGIFVEEIRSAGSYTRWAAQWSYLKAHWQSYVASLGIPTNHHWSRLEFMRAWYEDPNLGPQDRVDFELYPWHSKSFHGHALVLEPRLLHRFVLDPLNELAPPIVFAFGSWWWRNLPQLGFRVIARLGDGGSRPIDLGYRTNAQQGVVICRAPYGGLVVAEKHSGPSPGPPSAGKVARFRRAILEAANT